MLNIEKAFSKRQPFVEIEEYKINFQDPNALRHDK